MATFLQLVQDLARESGTLAGATSLTTLSGASNRANQLVYWTNRAWEDIQQQRNWNWMRGEFSSTLSIDTLRYTAASFGLTRFRNWITDTRFYQPLTIYDASIGQSDEGPLRFIPWDMWRDLYDRGSHDSNRPVDYSVSPARELCFGPKPDKAYAVRGEYWKSQQSLSADSDEPECPAEHHQTIVYRAWMLMGESDESPITIQAAQPEYRRRFLRLCEDQLPDVGTMRGNALA